MAPSYGYRYPDTLQQTIAKDMARAKNAPPNHGVYFIQAGTFGPIKIGHAQDVKHRRKVLQAGNHEQLRILSVFPTRNPEALEQAIHHHFEHLHIRGEWFRDDPELRLYILEGLG